MKLQLVLWDWNGTLLDDVTLCVDALNRLLARHGYARQYDLDGYRKIFGFPIRDYYLRAGFDFDRHSFDALAQSYMQDYVPASAACPLMPGAEQTLSRNRPYCRRRPSPPCGRRPASAGCCPTLTGFWAWATSTPKARWSWGLATWPRNALTRTPP